MFSRARARGVVALKSANLARVCWLFALVLVAALVAAGCGGKAEGKRNGVIHIGMTTGKDPLGVWPKIIKGCEEASKGRYVVDEFIMPPTVDAQREQMIRRLAGKDPSLDILGLDVIWTAEFSDAGWIYDMTKKVQPYRSQYIESALASAEYKGKIWAIPRETNVALLYYRTDLVKTPPKTWEELITVSKQVMKDNPGMNGYAWQANQYEGLTVDALEFIHGTGAEVLDETGKKSVLDEGGKAVKAFAFMRELFTSGVTPRAVLTYQEEESRQLFQSGKVAFLRNWPYVYQLAQQPESAVKGKVGVAPLPKFADGEPAAVTGGQNLAISKFSDNPDEAFELIRCLTSVENQKEFLIKKGNLPARTELYDDPDVLKQVPYIAAVRQSLDYAHSRPESPYYNDITVPLARISHEVAAGAISPEEAVKKADHSIQLAVEGNGEI